MAIGKKTALSPIFERRLIISRAARQPAFNRLGNCAETGWPAEDNRQDNPKTDNGRGARLVVNHRHSQYSHSGEAEDDLHKQHHIGLKAAKVKCADAQFLGMRFGVGIEALDEARVMSFDHIEKQIRSVGIVSDFCQ